MKYLGSAYRILQWIGVFSPSHPSTWSWWAFNVYRAFVCMITSSVAVLMTVQVYVSTDLTLLARTIDMWTMFLSGIYKWMCMVAFSAKFAELYTGLVRIQTQGSLAYGRSADRFTKDYLKLMDKITYCYVLCGPLVAMFYTVSPFLTYPQG